VNPVNKFILAYLLVGLVSYSFGLVVAAAVKRWDRRRGRR
jgi:hypothetical protein